MSGEVPHVKLGDHELPVPEQRIGRLENKLSGLMLDVTQTDLASLSGEDAGAHLISLGREKCYDALCIVVPQLAKRMPRWEFAGYGSAEAMAAREYDDDLDKSPTWPEITRAFAAAKTVNHFDFLDGLKNFAKGLYGKLDPTMAGNLVNLLAAEAASKISPSSAPHSGESASTSSTMNGRTTPVPVA